MSYSMIQVLTKCFVSWNYSLIAIFLIHLLFVCLCVCMCVLCRCTYLCVHGDERKILTVLLCPVIVCLILFGQNLSPHLALELGCQRASSSCLLPPTSAQQRVTGGIWPYLDFHKRSGDWFEPSSWCLCIKFYYMLSHLASPRMSFLKESE